MVDLKCNKGKWEKDTKFKRVMQVFLQATQTAAI